jgi:hypothetical protein
VKTIRLDSPIELDPSGLIEENQITFYIRRRSDTDIQFIAAREMKYRILNNEWLGPETKTVKPIVIHSKDEFL